MIVDLLFVLQATETVWRPGNEATCIKSLYSENPAIKFSLMGIVTSWYKICDAIILLKMGFSLLTHLFAHSYVD